MSRIRIDNPIQSGFAMVPNVLWTWGGLSFKAKGFFAYLLSHRDGSFPPVAAMERETGLGRDARKAVMRELIGAGLCHWHIEKDLGGRILSKWLQVTTRPLLAAIAQDGAHRAPENPSIGEGAHRAPENPSDGKTVATRLENRKVATENPAILQNQKDKNARGQNAAQAGRSASPRNAASRPASPLEQKAQAVSAVGSDAGRIAQGPEKRRALAASLGLPYLDTASGQWVRPSASLAIAGEKGVRLCRG